MPEIQEKSEESPKYQDFITFEPEPFKFVSKKERELVERHSKIIQALRQKKNMTVKEIHGLYYDTDTKKHTYTIKTIYKHLENLENENLVKISGHRMTQGSRQTEKLYARIAHIFYPDPSEWSESKREYIDTSAEHFNIIISEVLQVPKAEKNAFLNFFRQVEELKHQINIEILEKTKTSQQVVDVLTKVKINKLNIMNEIISTLIVLLRHPHLFEQLQNFFQSQ
ncbi:MAG: hypothetical protein ACFFBD_11695 [Candidatus Hodarchaeota archaeon]